MAHRRLSLAVVCLLAGCRGGGEAGPGPAPSAGLAPSDAAAGATGTGDTGDTDDHVAHLSVDSQPRRAQVFVDGRHRGRTPITLDSLPPGHHALRLEARGHHLFETDKQIRPGFRETLFVKLVARGSDGQATVIRGGRGPSGEFYPDEGTDEGAGEGPEPSAPPASAPSAREQP